MIYNQLFYFFNERVKINIKEIIVLDICSFVNENFLKI